MQINNYDKQAGEKEILVLISPKQDLGAAEYLQTENKLSSVFYKASAFHV